MIKVGINLVHNIHKFFIGTICETRSIVCWISYPNKTFVIIIFISFFNNTDFHHPHSAIINTYSTLKL